MMRGETGPDFIEALARGLDVIRAFEPKRPTMTLSEVAAATGLARPTARRMLLTLEELGYIRTAQGGFALTPRVLELGMAYIGSTSIWEIARPHMEQLVGHTGESSSLAQLVGSDIVYVSRVAVPKIITFAVTIGTRFPAFRRHLGKSCSQSCHLMSWNGDSPSQADQASRRYGSQKRKSETRYYTRCERGDGRSPTNTSPTAFARSPLLWAMLPTMWLLHSTSPFTQRKQASRY